MDRRQLLRVGLATAPLVELIQGWSTGRYTRAGGAEVAEVVKLTSQIRAADARSGGGAVLDQVRGALPWATSLLAARNKRPQLHHAIARLAEQIGFVAGDAGRPAVAQRCWRQALDVLDDDMQSLRTRIHASMARQSAWLGRYDDALRAAGEALKASQGREPATRALGWATKARVHAARGAMPEALAALDQADKAFHPTDDTPEWLAFSTEATFLADTGHACCDLVIAGHHELARQAQNRMLEAAALFGDAHARTRALSEVVEVRMLAVSGQADYADELGRSVLEDAAGLRSQRVDKALRRLRVELPSLRQQIDAVLTA